MVPLPCVPPSRPLQLVDLSAVSPELAYAAEDAELVILEGMVSLPVYNTSCSYVCVDNFVVLHA